MRQPVNARRTGLLGSDINRLDQLAADTPAPRFPVSGGDLLARGVASGKGVGEILKQLQADWIRAGFPREPDVIARLIDEAIAARSG